MTLVEQLKRDEGCRRVDGGLQDYRDSKGYWTRGYGHLIVPQPGPDYVPQVISERAAEQLLRDDIEKHRLELQRALPWVLDQPTHVFDALVNMVFNLGIPRLLGFENFLAAVREGNYGLAAIEGLDSKWYRWDVGPRAVRLMKQIVTGVRQ